MTKRLLLALLMAMAFVFCYQTAMAQDKNNYGRTQDLYDKGVTLMKQGDLDQAKNIFEIIKERYANSIPKGSNIDELILRCTTLKLTTNNLQFNAKGSGTKSIKVTTNAKRLTATSSTGWIIPSVKNGVVYVTCSDNNTPSQRKGTVKVKGDRREEIVWVTQQDCELRIEVEPDRVDFPKDGDLETVYVKTNASSWQVDSVPYWIEAIPYHDSIVVKAIKNESPYERQDDFYVMVGDAAYPVVVHQAGSDSLMAVSKEEMVVPSEETMDCFAVMTNVKSWNIEPSEDWITAWAEQDTVRVKVTQNTSVFSRVGRVRISAGNRIGEVLIHQRPKVSDFDEAKIEIMQASHKQTKMLVRSNPEELRVSVVDTEGESSVKSAPFELPVDGRHYTLRMGFESREVISNGQQQEVAFEPGMRFATITWAPKTSFGMMSGFVGAKSFGAYAHFQVNQPFIKDLKSGDPGLSGYNMTFGSVYRPTQFPYVGLYAGVGLGVYAWEPHVGLDYEAGVMGFYKHAMVTVGFHTSRLNSTVKSTSFTIGVGGYLKRYYDQEYGYCSSDSRRWVSVNYMWRPSENGRGVMVGDLGKNQVRGYVKALYLHPTREVDTIPVNNMEVGFGIVFTPAIGFIDMCAGASIDFTLDAMESPFQGLGAELGAIVNVWRFPLTVTLHEADLFGERHLCVDFGIGFHLGEFGWSKSSYQ